MKGPADPTSALSAPEHFAGRRVLVCGARVAGASAARALVRLGADVSVTDDGAPDVAANLPRGARFIGRVTVLPEAVDAVMTSPGLRPENPLLLEAIAAGIPVFGELELAWRLRGKNAARWLMVTGTNGKTTTVRMLESILQTAGYRALAVGNVGVPVIDAVMAEDSYDVLAVEASSFQLHHSTSVAPHAGVLLNLAPDHLDWHGSMAAYAAAKAKVFRGRYAIANSDDRAVMAALAGLGRAADSTFTLKVPGPGQYGVTDGQLLDGLGRVLLPVGAIRPAGAHNVANALAAAALAETVSVSTADIAMGLRRFLPDPHRNQLVARVADVDYVDDSKATNPHAAAASLGAYASIVWIAGGQLKDAPVDALVRDYASRLRAVVLIGQDRAVIADALLRHAPDVPLITVTRTDHGAMQDVVAAAASLAAAGDVVLLAPAAASLDMFDSYAQRGTAFSAAVGELSRGSEPTRPSDGCPPRSSA